MTFAVITHVPHIESQNQYFAYSPYVREMNIWSKYVDNMTIVAPLSKANKTAIDSNYECQNIKFIAIDSFDILSIKAVFNSLLKIPKISCQIFNAMKNSDHIHLRCPGNIGLLGCFIQILFPNKRKTTKYAGNWDPKSKQPWSYRLQKSILSNTFLTRNMTVLVYGEWGNSSKNIKSFFTATYQEKEKIEIIPKSLKETIRFIFVGTLVSGKNPMYAIQLVAQLLKNGHEVTLDLYGDGNQRADLNKLIQNNNLENHVFLKGNQTADTVKKAYQNSHFVLLPSESEGWPKAIAEGMFWGCVPISTAVACIPTMLDFGKRGVLLTMNLNEDVLQITSILQKESDYFYKSKNSSEWSRSYTLEAFENEIKQLLQ